MHFQSLASPINYNNQARPVLTWIGFVMVLLGTPGCGTGCISSGCSDSSREPRSPSSAVDREQAGQIEVTTIVDTAPSDEPALSLHEVGRALEAREIERADELLKGREDENDEARFLASRIEHARGNTRARAAWLARTSFSEPSMELQRRVELLEALQKTDAVACILEVDALFAAGSTLTRYRKRELHRTKALCHETLGQYEDASRAFAAAAAHADGRTADQLKLRQAAALLENNARDEAVRILLPLSFSGASAMVMEEARNTLAGINAAPAWNNNEQLARIERLISLKGFDAAQAMIAKLKPELSGQAQLEVKWLYARMLFNRRNHHPQAIKQAEEIIRVGRAHADDARFLKARALSRLDRDEEAIQAYLELARRRISPSLRDDSLFQAARLMYYLGRHRDALAGLQKLVGKGGENKKASTLSAEQTREAHFLAGLCALIEKNAVRAMPHFRSASSGTSDAEVLARNQYWSAVAQFAIDRVKGADGFERICAADPTAWYALHAGRRLEDADLPLKTCLSIPRTVSERSTALTQTSNADDPEVDTADSSIRSLAELSPRAALWKQMGLYREASRALREDETSSVSAAEARDWIVHYTALDAPQHAIRRATIGLNWSRRHEFLWRARSAYPRPYLELVTRETERHPLPPHLIYAIARKESLFDPGAVSSVGAMGMMQMMPATWETNRRRAGLVELSAGDLPGPEDSIIAGGYELAHLLKMFSDSVPLAVMGYNAGPSAVKRWLDRSGDLPADLFVEKSSFGQTRNYVRRVYANLVRYAQLYGDPMPVLPPVISRHAVGNGSSEASPTRRTTVHGGQSKGSTSVLP
jgi:soluble lytic murein transglycosylase-like protein